MRLVCRFCLVCCMLFAGAHRLPAPIIEQEKPTPTAEQSAKQKPKPKAESKSEAAPISKTNGTPFNVPQSQMRASATSQHTGYEATKAMDGNSNTIWHTPFSFFGPAVSLPQSIIVNLGGAYNISSAHHLPTQDSGAGTQNGNTTRHTLSTSTYGS